MPTILYLFSFSQSPNWSKELCEGPNILDCTFHITWVVYLHKKKADNSRLIDMEDTVDRFDLCKHMHFGVECLSAS